MTINASLQRGGRDRRLYTWVAVVIPVIVLAGFARTYYLIGLTDLCLIACVAFDTIKHRRLHPVFAWGTLLIVASQPLRLMLAGTDVWMRFATWLVS